MNNHFRSSSRRFLRALTVFAASALVLSARAQQAAAQAPSSVGGFKLEGGRGILQNNSLRIEGYGGRPVRIYSPQLDLSAPVILIDSVNAPRQVRAQNGVTFKLDLQRPAVNGKSSRVRVDARSREATLDIPAVGRRALTLSGNLDGFYEVDGARNSLKGQSAVISFGQGAGDVQATVDGGTTGVVLQLAGQSFGSSTPLGNVTLSGARSFFDQAKGTARLAGNARIVSSGAPGAPGTPAPIGKIDVSAPALEASLAQSGGRQVLSTVRTEGRARIVIDLPPSSTSTASNTSEVRAKPVRLEVAADEATVEVATQRLLLKGDVRGYYVLRDASGRDEKFEFSGDSAIARFIDESAATATLAAGLNLEVLGKPISIGLPDFNLNL